MDFAALDVYALSAPSYCTLSAAGAGAGLMPRCRPVPYSLASPQCEVAQVYASKVCHTVCFSGAYDSVLSCVPTVCMHLCVGFDCVANGGGTGQGQALASGPYWALARRVGIEDVCSYCLFSCCLSSTPSADRRCRCFLPGVALQPRLKQSKKVPLRSISYLISVICLHRP